MATTTRSSSSRKPYVPADPESARRTQIAQGIQPLWVLLPNGRPSLVSTARRDAVREALYFCREGDAKWRPIDELQKEDMR